MQSNETPEGDERASDSELMSRFYHCDEEAFAGIVERWWGRLIGFFRGRSLGEEDAEDLAQETLVKLYLTKDTLSFDTGQALKPFLFTIARNTAIQEWRHRKSEPGIVPINDAIETPAPAGALSPDLVADLLECVGSLPEMEHTYIQLCGKHGLGTLSHNEIAEVLGKWPAEMTRLSQRARISLRICLKRKGYHCEAD
jgi:RNA polymerase sigma-70 factor, ECF subfamily